MFSELQVTTNYSFLRSGSHPEEFVTAAAALGYHALGVADSNSLAGVRSTTSSNSIARC